MTASLFGINGSPTELNITAGYKSQTFIATAGQTLFSGLTNAYTPGTTTLAVFIDGNFVTDFQETSSTSFTTTTPLFAGQEVVAVTSLPLNTAIPLSLIGGSTGPATHTDYNPISGGSWLFSRTVGYTGGDPTKVNGGIRVDVYTNPLGTTLEWAGIFVNHNYSNFGENVGVYGQGNMLGLGSTWGGVHEACDMSFTSSLGKQGLIGSEIDCYANDTDVAGNRVGLQVVAGDAKYNRTGIAGLPGTVQNGIIVEAQTGGASVQFVNGLVINSATAAGVVVNTTASVPQAFRVQNHADIGFDTTLATIGIAAFRMAQGQSIAFNTAGTRQLSYNGAGLNLTNPGGATNYWSLNDNGSLVAGTTQLLGAQQTVTGSRGGNAALASLLTKCALHGFIIDSTTA